MNIFTYLRLSVLVVFSFILTNSHAQKEEDYFITVWDMWLDAKIETSIEFSYLATSDVNYSWETIPAGQNGSGKLTSNNSSLSLW